MKKLCGLLGRGGRKGFRTQWQRKIWGLGRDRIVILRFINFGLHARTGVL